MKTKIFKYQDIALTLEKRISSGEFKPGIALPPENILAEEYKVSPLTFRKAMDILVRNGRIERRPGRGTMIAGTCSSANSGRNILYAGDIGSHFFKELYLSLLKLSQATGQRIMAFDPASAKVPEDMVSEMRPRMDEAAAVICNRACLDAVASMNRRNQKTVVLVDIYDNGIETPPCYSISSNVFIAARTATGHLLNLGHRRIAFVGSPDNECGSSGFRMPARSRLTFQGYAASFFESNLKIPPNLAVGPLGETVDESEKSLSCWLETLYEWPTAFVCEGDFRAAALIRAASKLGKSVPRDFSVVGTGNTPWAEMINPPLTSVYMGEKEIARAAIMFAGQPPPDECRKLYVAPKLIIRNSTDEAVRR